MTLMLKSVSEISPVTKLDVISLVCCGGSIYHDFGSPKRTLKGHCVCCSQKFRPLTQNLLCKMCGLKLHRYCESYRQSVTSTYHKNPNFLSQIPAHCKQNFIIQNLVCKQNSRHEWTRLWIKHADHLCNVCNQPKPDFTCSVCDLSVHEGHCVDKLLKSQEELPSCLLPLSPSIQEIATSNLELKHHYIRTVDNYLSVRQEVINLWETKLKVLNDSKGVNVRKMEHGDVKESSLEKNGALVEGYQQILYPFGGVACLNEFINLPGAFGCIPGSGIIAKIASADTEKLQLLSIAPEMAIERSERETKEHDANPCSKDCSWLPTALCRSSQISRSVQFRAACGDNVIHGNLQEDASTVGRVCQMCMRLIRRNGLSCVDCGTIIHSYCEAFRLDKLRRNYPEEFFIHQLLQSNGLSCHPEQIRRTYFYCNSEERIPKRHNFLPVKYSMDKMLTPQSCVVCRKLILPASVGGFDRCDLCGAWIHRKCEKTLTGRCLKATNTKCKEAEKAFLVDDLTVSAIEKENFSIQEETSLIRSKTHQLEKLIYQLECSLKLKSATLNGLSKSASDEESKFNCLKLDVDENSTSSNDFAVSTSQPNDEQSIDPHASHSDTNLHKRIYNTSKPSDVLSDPLLRGSEEKCSTMQQSFDVLETTHRSRESLVVNNEHENTCRKQPFYCDTARWTADAETSQVGIPASRCLRTVTYEVSSITDKVPVSALSHTRQSPTFDTHSTFDFDSTKQPSSFNDSQSQQPVCRSISLQCNQIYCGYTEELGEKLVDGVTELAISSPNIKIKEQIVVWE